MPVNCSEKIFQEFLESCGSWITPEGEGQQFLYDALSEGMDFPGVVSIIIPELSDKEFDDWTLFEYWCEETRLKLMWDLIEGMDDYDEEQVSPRQLFKSKDAVFEKIIFILTDPDSEDSAEIMCVEIESCDKKLFLIYEGSARWGLGYGDSVLVVKSLDELTPDIGYYPLRKN